MTDKPCPLCGGTDLERHTQYLGWDELQELAMEEWADDVGGLLMVECRGCFCCAPVQTWNRRPDPWRYPPDMPDEGQRILFTYMDPDRGESEAIAGVYNEDDDAHCHPIVRWMPVPGVEE